MMDWRFFFPPGTRVIALPNWQHPRLYLPARYFLESWEMSSFYPASRLGARLYRLMLRIRAAAGALEVRTAHSDGWALGEFVQDTLPQAVSTVVLVGLPGPIQKVTAQLRDEKGRVLGYAKCSEKRAARCRLRWEHYMLSSISKGLGPEVLKYGALEDGDILLKTPIFGKRPLSNLPPVEGAVDFLTSLVVSSPVPVDEHPWVRGVRERGGEEGKLDACFEVLARKRWPVVVQHGDFTPWNVVQTSEGRIRAVDWEHGTLEGFPHLDLAHYALQTSALVYRRTPAKAIRYTVKHLTEEPRLALGVAEARVLARLAAYDAYRKTLEDGQSVTSDLQTWRRAVWEGVA